VDSGHISDRNAVCLHNGCASLRAPRTAKMSEIEEPFFSTPLDLLSKVKGIRFVTPERPDECCGFGGTFSVFEEPVSAKMGYDWDSCRSIWSCCWIRPASWRPCITLTRERAQFETRYGVFMTGPSATADIEGVLIHGAQGIRTLTVVLVASR
jgi:Cysteine-rich domain/LUD domain